MAKNEQTIGETIMEATKGEAQDNQNTTNWGSFKVEIGVEPPSRAGHSSKYPWHEFPAPADPEDPKTWPSVFIPDVVAKTIYGSLKAYRDKLQKDGEEAPEFTVSVSKDPKGVRVFRKK
ncbi:hypothetical protein H7H48_15750 [Nitratireductor sp. B36]|uniref:hypothetical protein n=1 Tax=Nitratireductor sp. B36 TaxID=2762059 RepID=UPI001E3034D7|nr:hypothetical protein [Nitratireductor sp. B36]MCC5780515.1 hypothetical protein [Nitratireductor sp. B36]